MSAHLVEERRCSKPTRFHLAQTVVDRNGRHLLRRYAIPPVADDEENKFVAKAVFWMILLGITPLILFHLITFFDPNSFGIPGTPI